MEQEENKISENMQVVYLILTSICRGNCARGVYLLCGQFNAEKSGHKELQLWKEGCKKG